MRSLRISDLSNLRGDGDRERRQDAGREVSSAVSSSPIRLAPPPAPRAAPSADYIRITSTVSWPSIGSRPPALVQSLVAPPNGSISETARALAVSVQNGQNQGVAGVGLSGSRASRFQRHHRRQRLRDLRQPAGRQLHLDAAAHRARRRDGDSPEPLPTSVVALSTNAVVLQYDTPGSIESTSVPASEGPRRLPVPTPWSRSSTGMTEAEAFGAIGGPVATGRDAAVPVRLARHRLRRKAAPTTTQIPTPIPMRPPRLRAERPRTGGQGRDATVELPALHLAVRSGTGPGAPRHPGQQHPNVTVTDQSCTVGGQPVERSFSTNAAGQLPDPGLPAGSYDVCVDDGARRVNLTADLLSFVLADFEDGTVRDVYLGGDGAGTCP